MKLRLKGNSIRVRLDGRDIERLIRQGRVDADVHFGPALSLSYAVETGPAPHECPEASYAEGRRRFGSTPATPRSGSQATGWASTIGNPSRVASSASSWRRTSHALTGRPGRRRTCTPSATRQFHAERRRGRVD